MLKPLEACRTFHTEGRCIYSIRMHIEIEAKMKVQDIDRLRDRLNQLGARCLGTVDEVNVYFDDEDRTLKAYDKGLRIRVNKDADNRDKSVYITHKGPRSHGGLKRRSETELRVESAEDAAALLVELGFAPSLTFEKHRETWELDQARVMIDTLPLLGTWIEIEGSSEAEVVAVREQLDLGEIPLIKASYAGLLRSYASENQMRDDVFRFSHAETP